MIIPMTHNWWWENFSNELVDRQSCGGNFAGPSPWLNQVAQTCIKWGLRREGPPMTYTHREWSSQTYDQYSWYTSGEMIQRTNGYWFYDVQLHWKNQDSVWLTGHIHQAIFRAMVVIGDCPADYQSEVRSRCTTMYGLLLKAARPVLQHGTEAEATWSNIGGHGVWLDYR